MSPIDGAIRMEMNINHPQTTDVNISEDQPSKASGLGEEKLRQEVETVWLFYTSIDR